VAGDDHCGKVQGTLWGGGGLFFFLLCFFFGIQVRETFSFGSLLSSASGQMLSSNSSSTSCFPWPLVCMCERIARMSFVLNC
jgi:hypothetical protein